MVHANIIYSNREIQEILRNKTNESTLYLMYDDIFFEEINKIVGTVENREYTKEEWNMMESSILADIMSKSSKNGDISKSRNELDSVLTKIERYRA